MRLRASAKASRLSVIWAAVVAVGVMGVDIRGLDLLGEEAAGWLLWVISMGSIWV
jgi:hypothetical protein